MKGVKITVRTSTSRHVALAGASTLRISFLSCLLAMEAERKGGRASFGPGAFYAYSRNQ